MPGALADRLSKAGRPLWWVAGLVVVGLVVGGVLLTRRTETAQLPPESPGPSSAGPTTREDAAAALLEDLSSALRRGTLRQVKALAAPGDARAARELADVFHNVRAVGITGLTLRYVDENEGRLSASQSRRFGQDAWVGDVQLGWRVGGYDRGGGTMEVTMTFDQTPRGAAFVSARGDYGDPAPLWLLERLSVQRSQRALVMVAAGRARDDFAALANQAAVDVKKVLSGWRGRLVVEVPSTEDELNRVLGADAHTYDAIAAVTAPIDGSMRRGAPTHVFINPPVFGQIGAQGAQVVVSHEAAHVATGAAMSTMPMWLLEGFADYVALADVNLPVSVTASQILADVRKHGPPRSLPGPAEFDPRHHGLGASYESAWLACRLLAEKYGAAKLIRFYWQSDREGSTESAFRQVLGTDERSFTREWRQYLRGLAS